MKNRARRLISVGGSETFLLFFNSCFKRRATHKRKNRRIRMIFSDNNIKKRILTNYLTIGRKFCFTKIKISSILGENVESKTFQNMKRKDDDNEK